MRGGRARIRSGDGRGGLGGRGRNSEVLEGGGDTVVEVVEGAAQTGIPIPL